MVYSLVVRARGLEYGGREFESRSLHLKPETKLRLERGLSGCRKGLKTVLLAHCLALNPQKQTNRPISYFSWRTKSWIPLYPTNFHCGGKCGGFNTYLQQSNPRRTVVSENWAVENPKIVNLFISQLIIYEYYLKSVHISHFLSKYVFIPHFAYLVKRHHNLRKKLKLNSNDEVIICNILEVLYCSLHNFMK